MKKTYWILLSIVFLGVSIVYWGKNNSSEVIPEIESNVLQLIKSSSGNDYETLMVKAETTRLQMVNSKQINTPVREFYEKEFLAAWAKKKLDKTTATALYNKAQLLFLSLNISAKSVQWNQLICMLVISILFGLLVYLAFFTCLLRDTVSAEVLLQWKQTAAAAGTQTPTPAFSLARTQLAVWIFIIASFYIYSVLWNLCGSISINQTALILMGISAGTFAAGAMVDTTEINQGIPRSQNGPSSGNFVKDILSDNNGISIHRFQNVAWTLIAIIIYFYRYNNMATGDICLPELDSTLLALTGISGATYLTLKTRENTSIPATLKSVKIQLDPTAIQLPAVLASVQAAGLGTAVITLKNTQGGMPITATFVPGSLFDFAANDVPPATYLINASWTGQAGGNTVTLTGANTVALSEGSMMPVKIQMK